MGDNLERLEQVIINDERVGEHEDGLRDFESIIQLAFCLWFKMLDAVIGDISNSSSSECWNFRNLHVLVVSELFLQRCHGFPGNFLLGTSLDNFKGILIGNLNSIGP